MTSRKTVALLMMINKQKLTSSNKESFRLKEALLLMVIVWIESMDFNGGMSYELLQKLIIKRYAKRRFN